MPVHADPRDEELVVLRAEVARLAAELTRVIGEASRAADAARDDAAAAVARTRDEALKEGRKVGIAASEGREGERLAVLKDGIAAETDRFRGKLDALDGLAAALARACLARMFSESEEMGDMVAATLARHVDVLRDQTVLAVTVSGADFDDTYAVEATLRATGNGATVSIDPDLPSGACRMTARPGRIDLDVPAQWSTLAELLDGMAGA